MNKAGLRAGPDKRIRAVVILVDDDRYNPYILLDVPGIGKRELHLTTEWGVSENQTDEQTHLLLSILANAINYGQDRHG